MDSPSQDSAQAVERKQQLDAERLLPRREELQVADVTVNDTLEQSSAAVIRQTIRDLLFRDAETSNGGIVVSGRFWRRFANRGSRRLPAGQLAECQERIDFVLGEVDLSEVVERRWQEIPELSQEERTRLVAVRVAEPCERLQALEEAFEQGLFDFVVQLLACSYSRYGRRPHHPLLLSKVWLAMLSMGTSSPARFQ
jgi:hypothetical protein